MENIFKDIRFIERILLLAGLVLFIIYFSQVMQAIKVIWTIVLPLFLGFVIAYVVNILMSFLEKLYFPNTKRPWLLKTKRPICLILSYVLIILIIVIMFTLVLPKVVDTIRALSTVLPGYLEQISRWSSDFQKPWPFFDEWMRGDNFNWDSIVDSIASYVKQGVSGILTSSLNMISTLASGFFNLIVAIAFSAYLLLNKEKLLAQAKKLQRAFMKKEAVHRLNTMLSVTNESFTNFITGQCTEAVILGVLCMLGMIVFGFPYATSIGIFIGVTSLIPILGAYLGSVVGVLLIFPVDPMKALLFFIFIIVLQQLEGNLIYPKVIGTSIGLPGIWVFAAVIIGGRLGGIVGMLFGVPIAATMYKLLRIVMNDKLKKHSAQNN